MRTELSHLLAGVALREGAAPADLDRLVATSPVPIPADYLEFLGESNGGEGAVGKGYLQLWRAEDLPGQNEAYAVAELEPDLYLFGSDGGDTAYAFRQGPPATATQFVAVPFIGMGVEAATALGTTVVEFFQAVAEGA